MDVTSNECLSEVRSLLSCPVKITVARSFRGNEAQTFIDFLDQVSRLRLLRIGNLGRQTQVLVRSCLDDKFRQRSLLLLSKICKAQSIVPGSYILRRELISIGRVSYRGGFADVCNGEYLRSPVAVKCLRMGEGDPNRIFKVSLTNPMHHRYRCSTLTLAIMSRDHRLETFVPSECPTLVRGLRIHRPGLFPHSHRVDDQRECDAVCKVQSRGESSANGKPRLQFCQNSALIR